MDVSPLGFPVGFTPDDDEGGEIMLTPLVESLPKGLCGTGDNFQTTEYSLKCDLVDMEGYPIAKICRRLNVGVSLIKFVSDGSNEHAAKDWHENISAGAEKLYNAYLELTEIYALQKNH